MLDSKVKHFGLFHLGYYKFHSSSFLLLQISSLVTLTFVGQLSLLDTFVFDQQISYFDYFNISSIDCLFSLFCAYSLYFTPVGISRVPVISLLFPYDVCLDMTV